MNADNSYGLGNNIYLKSIVLLNFQICCWQCKVMPDVGYVVVSAEYRISQKVIVW